MTGQCGGFAKRSGALQALELLGSTVIGGSRGLGSRATKSRHNSDEGGGGRGVSGDGGVSVGVGRWAKTGLAL